VEFFDGLVLHLQRSECVSIAHTVNVPSAPQNIAFHHRAMNHEDYDDESDWEMNLNDKDAIMENNENDGETCSEVVNNNEFNCDNGDEGVNDTNVSDSNDSDASDYETVHDQMDWYHVLHTHGSCRKKGIAVPTVLDERIEEYILQGIAEEFNPTFNEDVIATETLTNINIGNVAVPLEESMHQFPEINNAKVR